MFENLTFTLAQTDARPDAPATPGTPSTPANTGGAGTHTTATTGADGQPLPPQGAKPPEPFGGMGLPLMLLVFLALMFGMTMFGQRKEKKKRAAMLASMKKNDKVVTIGGIIGTVVEVKDNEVIVKVDESSNTRMRFSRSAIQGIISEEAAG